jgi:hypothetical protein
MVRKAFLPVVVTLLLLGLAANVGAQSVLTGSVQGTVKDTEGAVLPGVVVTALSDVLVSGHLVAVSDERGVYRFPSLPPGAYAIEAELAGFQKLRQEDVRVRLGQALAVDFVLPLSKVAEQITVTAESPVISVVDNTVATSFDSSFLDSQPLPRDFYALLAAAPGVTLEVGSTSSMMAYGGTSQSQNAYTMDGVNVADTANGQYWLLPSIQWMQEIQIGGLGANAEYGGYTGGIINGVTKSGGNQFHGGVEYYYQPKSWTDTNDPSGQQTPFAFTDASISLGGPVVKDKLWYFLSGEYWQQQQTPIGALAPDKRTTPRYLGKLTWQANDGNRLWAMAEQDKLHDENRGVDIYTLPEASSDEKSPNNTYALNWESLINASNFVNLKATGYTGQLNYLPYNGDNTPGRNDYSNTGIYWQNQMVRTLRDKKQLALDASWSLFQDALLGANDNHSFKFGASYENGAATYLEYRNGGVSYYDDSSSCPGDTPEEQFAYYKQHPECGVNANSDAYYNGIYQEWLQTKTFTLYAQDSMRLSRWTINFGVRYSQFNGGFQQGHGNTDVYKADFVDPRIGFVWDVLGDGRTAVKAHWGRYHQKMFGYIYDREASGQIDIPYKDCYWNPETGKYELDSNGDLGCDLGTPEYASMGKYGHQYVDETLITFEQQLGKEMMVGVDLIDRRFRDIMAMVNANNDYTLVTATDNPLTGGTLPIYVLNSPQQYVLTTDNAAYDLPDAYRNYKSVILRFDKRYSHGWQLWSSFVWTDLKGNQYSNDGYVSEFQDKNGFTNADGHIDESYNKYDFKLNAAVDLPLNLQLSGQYNYLSGMYWTPYVRVRSGLDYNSVTGRYINLLPRGSYKLPDRNLIDLRVAWTARLGGSMKLTASLECFNVTNSSTALAVDGQWGTYRATTNAWSAYDTFGQVTAIENPRQYRAGLRFEF